MTDDEILTVVQAQKDGKVIQWRDKDSDNIWAPRTVFYWDFRAYDYRSLPVLKEIWVCKDFVFYSLEKATVYREKYLFKDEKRFDITHYREVLNEQH